MTFVSLPFFLFVFGLVVVYFLTPQKYQWLVLLVASYAFYWLNSKWLVLVLWGSTMVTFLTGFLLQKVYDKNQQAMQALGDQLTKDIKKQMKAQVKRAGKRIMLVGVLLVTAALLMLKYFNFFGENLNQLFQSLHWGATIPRLNLLLPLGISYYTLQAIAYMVDVYREKTCADRNPLRFMLFLSFFPQIVQGPIARHSQLAKQLYAGHRFDFRQCCFGAQLVLWGLFKKLVIAERLAIPVNYMFQHYNSFSGPILFLTVALYGLQVYTDFSGGMEIARGVAQMLGIELELNFKQPYFSTSIEDFWRRWHITMGSWMKDYIFYPLSLSKAFTKLSRRSRKILGQYVGKRLPAFLAMFIVYFLVGFWHGANWKYVVYGLWNGTFIMSGILLEGVYAKAREKCGIQEEMVTWRMFRMIRTFVIVSFGRFFSGALNLSTALTMFQRTFYHWKDISFLTNGKLFDLGHNNANWILLVVAIVVLFYVDYVHEMGVHLREVLARQPLVFRWVIYIGAILVVMIFGHYGPAYDAASFIYEQF